MCLGNICRSPYVEAYLKKAGSDLDLEVESRGFIGPGRPAPPEALDAAGRRGVDTGAHVSALVDEEALRTSDLVLLVDPAHEARLRREFKSPLMRVLVLGDLDPEPADGRTIRDPWGNPPEVFDQVFERLDRCMDVLLEEWRGRGSE